MAEILIVDDDQSVATAFGHFLDFAGHGYRLASNAEDAVRLIAERRPNLVMMDVRMPGVDGLQALEQIRNQFPDVPVAIMTAYGTSQTSIDAIRAGAFDYLTKPLDLDQLTAVINKALAAQQVSGDSGVMVGEEATANPPVSLVGDSPAMLDMYKMIGRLATNDVPALVVGERGTGKRLVILTIHDNSSRRDRGFLTIDCATLTESAIGAVVFGPEDGTIQLDSIETLSQPLQARLASALGGERRRGVPLQARVIASTECDLGDRVESGAFSRDLYDALAVITLRITPLRERRDDIPLLVRHFVQRFNAELNRAIKGVDDQVSRMLQGHAWPGNVGELERAIKRACIVARSDVLTVDDIGQSLSESRFPGTGDAESALERSVRAVLHDRLVQNAASAASAFHHIVESVESALVREALTITNGNQVKAADILGVNRATLRKKMPPDST